MEQNRASTFFPVFLDLSERNVLVVGAGRIGARRALALEPFAPHLTVVAPEAADEVRALASEGRITWVQGPWADDMLAGADVVLACTDDHALNEAIYEACRERGILVNICSDHDKCDFYFPGIVRKGDFTVGVNASGRHHAKARELRERIQALLDEFEGGDDA